MTLNIRLFSEYSILIEDVIKQGIMRALRTIVILVLAAPIVIVGYAVWRYGWTAESTVALFSIVSVGTVLAIVVRRHAQRHQYRCELCSEQFTISAWTDFVSPHYPGKKRLVCPKCGEPSWCVELPIDRLSEVDR
jgi:DNA-directed RNA polymerase subunit RPC12/RpoP